ncbi:MAG: aminodeoxychorismate/anthranilate synthase component II [Rubricoccaceae bacterium]|nr:aminodeoxychorismate/anthranilate synthase component II [Rubricoccaceae bacterium]
MILVLDNYDSFTYTLVHLVERAAGEVRVVRNDAVSVEDVVRLAPAGVLISPGPGHPDDAGISEALIRRLGATTPILGVCLGMQALAEVYGGRVGLAPAPVHGKTSPVRHDGRGIFRGVAQGFLATRYHSLVVDPASLPDALEVSAWTDEGTIMGLRHRALPVRGVQFHPESVLTTEGPRLIENWTRSVLRAPTAPAPFVTPAS